MTEIPALRIWPPSRFPLIHEARKRFRSGGKEAVTSWVASLSPIEKGDLATQMIHLLAEASGRDPVEVALEIFNGKGFSL